MLSKPTQSFYIIVCMLIVITMGFFFKYYTGPAHEWFNDYGAAVFYEIFWCLFAFVFFRNRAAVNKIPLWVFIITCILEFLQLWHPPLLEEFRTTLIGKWLIGTTFSWWDFPHYVLGCVLGWLWLRQLHGNSYAKKSES
ncbi:DUF2809 domain-containing protein [Scytonema tolypothrichoides VB-61278]|nr:DUF2809 domain-containing protein [Scytonema tolypothrichoides VB-61278]